MPSLDELKALLQDFRATASHEDREDLKTFIADTFFDLVSHDHTNELADTMEQLQAVAEDIRPHVDVSGDFPSTKSSTWPQSGEFSELNPETTVVYDDFLYPDSLVDQMMDDGTIPSHYCNHCGSHDTAPLDIISHSAPVPALAAVFRFILPAAMFPNQLVVSPADVDRMRTMTLVDVGSRLGPVLFGAAVLADFGRLVGLEISAEYNDLVSKVAAARGYGQISVQQCDVTSPAAKGALSQADVLYIHNVFDFFVDPARIIAAWSAVIDNITTGRTRPGFAVTKPSLETMLGNAGMGQADIARALAKFTQVDSTEAKAVACKEITALEDRQDVIDDITVYTIAP
ncbi:hypothetical protein J8273_6579 [Carpediemonas membranifera]|uniref:Methyltransferase domain-containing protein n=1 Tax=Carpediemonas membranifera TaxID=201153 RepID=A0A8J6AUD4_9EUKA|nr:hypothetical protein J8273_6579 [Carpediemonas membranifera]|eukprot:KAG9391800.1 hypothetical protein J8273_6579 [Carpediemonas membranifera]